MFGYVQTGPAVRNSKVFRLSNMAEKLVKTGTHGSRIRIPRHDIASAEDIMRALASATTMDSSGLYDTKAYEPRSRRDVAEENDVQEASSYKMVSFDEGKSVNINSLLLCIHRCTCRFY